MSVPINWIFFVYFKGFWKVGLLREPGKASLLSILLNLKRKIVLFFSFLKLGPYTTGQIWKNYRYKQANIWVRRKKQRASIIYALLVIDHLCQEDGWWQTTAREGALGSGKQRRSNSEIWWIRLGQRVTNYSLESPGGLFQTRIAGSHLQSFIFSGSGTGGENSHFW